MLEAKPVALDADDAVALCLFQPLVYRLGVRPRRGGDQLHSRVGDAGRGEEQLLDLGVEGADPGTRQITKRA